MASERLLVRLALEREQFSLDVALELGPGPSVLFGPSGAGKSTILAAISGLVRPRSGRVALGAHTLFDSDQGIDLPPHERRLGLVFQSLALFPHLDALSNVAYGVPSRLRGAERLQSAHGFLERMRVAHLARRYPGSFSGGEAQRVALARALASEPRALLLDEPFSALDEALAHELGNELLAHTSALGLPVVLVTHDRALARALGADANVAMIRDGRVEAVGAVRDLLSAAC